MSIVSISAIFKSATCRFHIDPSHRGSNPRRGANLCFQALANFHVRAWRINIALVFLRLTQSLHSSSIQSMESSAILMFGTPYAFVPDSKPSPLSAVLGEMRAARLAGSQAVDIINTSRSPAVTIVGCKGMETSRANRDVSGWAIDAKQHPSTIPAIPRRAA